MPGGTGQAFGADLAVERERGALIGGVEGVGVQEGRGSTPALQGQPAIWLVFGDLYDVDRAATGQGPDQLESRALADMSAGADSDFVDRLVPAGHVCRVGQEGEDRLRRFADVRAQ